VFQQLVYELHTNAKAKANANANANATINSA
jgi:hypothetical protein